MGLFSALVTLPLAPVRGVVWLGEQVAEVAEDEYYDPADIREELRALAEALDAGEISAAEFDAAEDELLDRLEEAEARREARG